MIEKLEKLLDKYNNLQNELTKQEVLEDINLTKKYSKEKNAYELFSYQKKTNTKFTTRL